MSLASVIVGRLRASVVNTWIAQINRLTLGASDDVFSSRGGCTLSTTSASYVDVTNASKAFTKVGSSSESDLLVELSVCCYATAAPTVVKFAVQVNGTGATLTASARHLGAGQVQPVAERVRERLHRLR